MKDVQECDLVVLLAQNENDRVEQFHQLGDVEPPDGGGDLTDNTTYIQPRSTQPCIPPGLLNRVPASAGGKGWNVTSAGWQVTLCAVSYTHLTLPTIYSV